MGKLIDIDYIIKGYALGEHTSGFHSMSMRKEDIYRALVDAPAVEVGDSTVWHPIVEGKLTAPADNGRYLVTVEGDMGDYTQEDNYVMEADYDIDHGFSEGGEMINIDDVIAWAEMPKSYKEGRSHEQAAEKGDGKEPSACWNRQDLLSEAVGH